MYLQKKILVLPVKGQYEQQCNAAALEKLGVKTLSALDSSFSNNFNNWLYNNLQKTVLYTKSTETIVDKMVGIAEQLTEMYYYGEFAT